jgi:hypothetical protein
LVHQLEQRLVLEFAPWPLDYPRLDDLLPAIEALAFGPVRIAAAVSQKFAVYD